MPRAPLLAGLVVLATFAAQPAAGDHAQAAHGDVIVFDHKGGNEWWVEVKLTGGASGSVQGVDAMDTGGPWVALSLKSWGNWAASFHIEPGHQVKFRAKWAGGDQALSCAFTHPAGAEQCATAPFNASFTAVQGNTSWVQATVTANRALAGVDARVNGGTWQAMTQQPGGAWGKAMSVPAGKVVQLRARSTDGAFDTSDGGWKWTAATPYPTAGSTLKAYFENAKGNAGWVQINVYANRALDGVDARLDGGPWNALTRQTYGDWARAMTVPDGTLVQFRARAGNASVLSREWVWPNQVPAPAWPVAGSYANYVTRDFSGAPDGSWSIEHDGAVDLTYNGTAWSGTCHGSTSEWLGYEGRWNNTTYSQAVAFGPLKAPVPVSPGQDVNAQVAMNCFRVDRELVVRDQAQVSGVSGEPTWSYRADEDPDASSYRDWYAAWDTRRGLVLDWNLQNQYNNARGSLEASDAPLA